MPVKLKVAALLAPSQTGFDTVSVLLASDRGINSKLGPQRSAVSSQALGKDSMCIAGTIAVPDNDAIAIGVGGDGGQRLQAVGCGVDTKFYANGTEAGQQ